MPGHLVLAILAASGLLATLAAGPAGADPLARYRWTSRLLVVSAPRDDDPALRDQRHLFQGMGAGARERDLVLVEAVGTGAQAATIRSSLKLDPGGFAAVLVGKDGGAKLRSTKALGPDQLYPLIDAMPMRQQEMQR